MARLTFLFLTLIYSFSVLNARTIQGGVMSSNDSTTVIGANCQLLSDGKIITGTTTNAEGVFYLETDVKSTLNLEVSMTGFSSTDIIIESGG